MNSDKLFNGFFTGINYWALKNATNMWEDFDAESIEEDLKVIAAAGITHLRIFPSWHVFQPLKALYTTNPVPFDYRFGEEQRPDTPAGRAGVSEEACEHFSCFCDLAEKYGLKLIVALITGHMSFREYAPPAFAGKNRLSDPTVLKWQIKFVRYFVSRFKDRECIAGWDLGNEVNNMVYSDDFQHSDDFYVWCSAISNAARVEDPIHPIVSGMSTTEIEKAADNLEVIRDTCDVHTCHPYNIFQTNESPLTSMRPILDLPACCQISSDVSGVPTFVQEFGSIGYMNCSLKTEADFYRACLFTSLAHGCHGVMWWCAFDQGHLRFAPYVWNNIGSDYGFFDKKRIPKPIVAENIKFHKLLDMLPGGDLPAHTMHGTVLIPRDNGDADKNILLSSYILGEQAGINLNFSYSLNPIPDSPLYILPSLRTSQSITANRLDELLEKVAAGSILYFSVGDCLFRDIPKITGVTIGWRAVEPSEKILDIDGEKIPVHCPVWYQIESIDPDTKALAYDEEGNPVFFEKEYGNGKVFFSLVPFESDLASRRGAFYADDFPAYEIVYKILARAAGIYRLVETDCRYVSATEHPIDEKTAYVTFINYSPVAREFGVNVNGGHLAPLYNGEIIDGKLYLKENDGAVFVYHMD